MTDPRTVTAAWLPEGIEWAPFNADMRSRGLVIAGGQGKWAGRIFRFGHMGEVGIDEMVEAIRILGETLPAHGFEADARRSIGNRTRGLRGRHRPRAVSQRLIFVRHGVTEWNREGRWQGRLDPPLSDGGRREARMIADRIAADPDLRPARILSSTLARASETAGIIGASVGIVVEPEPRLVEIGAGEWEGRTHAELAASDGERYRAWRTTPGYGPPGGEPISEATERVRSAPG